MLRAIPPLLLLAGCAPEVEREGGIVSLNPCADQLLIELVPHERIRAISHYSKLPGSSSISPEQAAKFDSTAGTAEEVIALAPDLVVATSFTPPATRVAFERAGLKTLYLDSPTTIAASKAQIRELAQTLGVAQAGTAMIQRIDDALTATPKQAPAIPTLLYISGDLVSGGGNLLDEMLTLSGFENAASWYGLSFTGTLPVETILSQPPALILSPDSGGRSSHIRDQLLGSTQAKVEKKSFDPALIHCGGPTIPHALKRLRELRQEMKP